MKMNNEAKREVRPVTFTAKEAAQYLGVSYSTVLMMARRQIDQLPHIKVESRFLFRKEALDQWMMAHDGVKTEVMGYDFKINTSSQDILGKIIFSMIDEELTKRKLSEYEKEIVFLNVMEVIKSKYLSKPGRGIK
jgi:excisionase family DNA binding protein